MFQEFKKFILRGNVVDLAVGVVIGAAFTTVVNSFVTSIINPLVELFYHGGKFSNAYFMIGDSRFNYGLFINALISFLIVATVVFFFVVQPINRLSALATKSKSSELPEMRKCPECMSDIPKEATRCKFCTTKIEPA